MTGRQFHTKIGQELAEGIVSAARTSLGDTLRTVVYFTPSSFDVLYVRSDLYDSREQARGVKEQLVEFERVGFAEVPARSAVSERDATPTIGPYQFTVRFHEDGFLLRVLGGDAGVLLTLDSMDVNAFEDAATAIKRLLQGR
jgi:hypothetical protein